MFCIPPGGVSPSRHTACAFVVGKNYRLQDIQLSKSFFYPGEKSLGSLRRPRDFSPGPPRLTSLAGPLRPAPLVRQNFLSYAFRFVDCKGSR
jgi:hypothetical protein